MYPYHPREFAVVGPVIGDLDHPERFGMPTLRKISPGTNPFTGKVASIVDRRLQATESHPNYRLPILRHALCEGSAWEMSTTEALEKLCAVTKNQSKAAATQTQQRLGSKMATSLERVQAQSDLLVGDRATLFRALAARAMYLAG